MNIFGKNKSTGISLPKAKVVHGIEIKKVPVGKYIEAIGELEQLPDAFIDNLFPNQNIENVLSKLAGIDAKSLLKLFLRLLIVSPKILLPPLAKILDTDENVLINKLTPNELKNVIKEYWAMNDMTDFFGDVLGLLKAKLPALTSGFSAGSPSAKASASAKKAS